MFIIMTFCTVYLACFLLYGGYLCVYVRHSPGAMHAWCICTFPNPVTPYSQCSFMQSCSFVLISYTPSSSRVAIRCHFPIRPPPSLPHTAHPVPSATKRQSPCLPPSLLPCLKSPLHPFKTTSFLQRFIYTTHNNPGSETLGTSSENSKQEKGRMSYHNPLGSHEGGDEEECPISMLLFLC